MLHRLFSLIRKEFIQIVRDPRTLAITFIMPIMMMVLLGYAATNDVRNIALVVLDEDQTPASRRLMDAYRAADYFRLSWVVNSEDEMRALIDNNSAGVGIIIPPGYGRNVAGWKPAQVAFVVDGSDPTMAGTALSAATFIGQQHSTELMLGRLEARGFSQVAQQPVDVRTTVWYNPGMVSANFMVPAMIGIILQFLTTMLTATSIVRERERGTIEQLIVTPLRSWELVLGKLAPYVVIAFLTTIEVLIVGVVAFKMPINGSVLLLLLLTGLFLVTTLATGLFISTLANTQQEAMMTTMLTLLPAIYLSGFFFPIAAMPKWLQIISLLFPLRYFLVIARGIVVKGVGISALWQQVFALILFGTLVTTAAVLRFRRSLD